MGKQRVNGAQQPEGHTAQGHSKDALGRGEPGRAVGHHLSVPKRIAYARNEDQCQRLQRAGGFHAFQMGQLEHKDSGQDDRGKQEVFDRNSAAEQGRQQHTGHNGYLPGGGNEPGFPIAGGHGKRCVEQTEADSAPEQPDHRAAADLFHNGGSCLLPAQQKPEHWQHEQIPQGSTPQPVAASQIHAAVQNEGQSKKHGSQKAVKQCFFHGGSSFPAGSPFLAVIP